MSVEELRFKQEFEVDGQKRVNHCNMFKNSHGSLQIKLTNGKTLGEENRKYAFYVLDREQAHLLMLYLQEHLGAVQQKEI